MRFQTRSITKACDRCGDVTFQARVREHSDDELQGPTADVIDRILDHGQCQIALNAKFPGHPTQSELQECPVFREI